MASKLEYCVVEDKCNVDSLIEEVNTMIEKGWKPIGGISVDHFFYQAMVREVEDSK